MKDNVFTVTFLLKDGYASDEAIAYVNHHLCNQMAEMLSENFKLMTRTPHPEGLVFSKKLHVFRENDLKEFIANLKEKWKSSKL